MIYDYEELACHLCGLDYDKVCEDGDEWSIITDALEAKYGVDFDTFAVGDQRFNDGVKNICILPIAVV